MAEPGQITFTYKEIVEALLKKQRIHEGIWGIYIKFGIRAANMGMSKTDVLPTAMVPVLDIGLQRFDEESNIAVDAAKVNPEPQMAQKSTTAQRRSKPKIGGAD